VDAEGRLEEAAARTSAWLRVAQFTEGRAELERLLAACPGTSVARVRGLVAAGTLAFFQGDADAARPRHREACSLAEQLGDDVGIAEASIGLARVGLADGDPEAVRTWSERALEVRRRLDDDEGVGEAIHHLAEGARMSGDLAGARRLYEESLAIKRALGSESGIALELLNLGNVGLAEGDVPQAEERLRESLRLGAKLDLRRSNPFRLIALAGVASARGDARRAARLLGAADGQLATTGGAIDPADRADHEALVERVRAALGGEFDQASEEGRSLSAEDAIAEALA
jgi:tetratricopeptide (TPR) repeat protein